MAMKVFVSLPVKNHDRQWIETEREEILNGAPGYFKVPEDEIEPVPFVGPWQLTGNHPVYCLGFNLQLMSQADIVVFHPDWWESKACVLQHDICEQYGIKHLDLSWRPSWDKDDGAMENERKQSMTKKTNIAPPWITFARKVHKLFECDPEVVVEWNDDGKALKLYVSSQEKADALTDLLPAEKEFGNVIMTISVIPANDEDPDIWALFQTAFKGNAAVSFMDELEGEGFHAGYIVFQPEVVQYYNDNIGDIHGIESTLYQEIAKEVFEDYAGIFFCTDIEDQKFLGRPLGEWP